MKNLALLTVFGLLSFAGYASADAEVHPLPAGRVGQQFQCRLEGRGVGSGSHQDEGVRCWVSGSLRCIMDTDRACSTSGSRIEIKCSNGFKLEDEYPAVTIQKGTLWINADKHDKIATLRVKDFYGPAAETPNNRFESKLIGANAEVIDVKGKCKFEGGGLVPVPPPVN